MRRLLPRAGVRLGSTHNNPASKNTDGCGNPVRAAPDEVREAMPALCRLLAADYACLGYELPRECVGATGL